MLVLTRKANEKIVIGNDVIVTVVGIAGNKVKLAIQAPHDVIVLRSDLKPEAVTQVEANITARDQELKTRSQA